MSNKMLIDASHPEETRVVVVHGNRIEEFDFESEHKKQLKSNIYLARVTRVEPSLQAAFVDYGGNRHGFLAFSEIHPDYYQIPLADRLALLEAEEQAANKDNDEDENGDKNNGKQHQSHEKKRAAKEANTAINTPKIENTHDDSELDHQDESVESIGAEDAFEEVPTHHRDQVRQYKIQEVIKRRQILLVQIVKEERGNKGAALTTYLSLAGRYSVLMPNTARGGGISRKITNIQDRKRLKDIVKGLDVPKGMGVILRTAGANRTKVEIKRDYEYLMRLWENVRNLTLQSTATSLVYEEGSLIKRSIRDLYNKDITEILVSGDAGYREAKSFMRMLLPSYAKVVQPYRNPFPIFVHNGIESQLDKMIQPQVDLKSGGYLVINQTEALVAIDVNSGRSTKENSVEETAYQTNLEAASEVARQLRLRDLAGLVVIDFIDMEEKRNVRAIEKKLKDCLKEDRARIQVGRISHFGLMEMSRQRIRASVLESTTQPCPHCHGTGYIRSQSFVALHVVRSIEEYLLKSGHFDITVHTSAATALYVLNNKRAILADLEKRFGLEINIEADDTIGLQHLTITKGAAAKGTPIEISPLVHPTEQNNEKTIETPDNKIEEKSDKEQSQNKPGEQNKKQDDKSATHAQSSINGKTADEERRHRRRRGRRGGRRNRENSEYNGKRIPYAEPVGPFAQAALAEVRHDRQQRQKNQRTNQAKTQQNRVPAAEPVGTFASGTVKENKNAASQKPRRAKRPQQKRKKIAAVTQQDEVTTKSADNKSANNDNNKTIAQTASAQNDAQQANMHHDNAQQNIKSHDPAATDSTNGKKTKKRERKPKNTTTKTNNNSSVLKNTNRDSDVSKSKKEVEDAQENNKQPVKKTKTTTQSSDSLTAESAKQTIQAKAPSEPVITSSLPTEKETIKPKKIGWWQRKGSL